MGKLLFLHDKFKKDTEIDSAISNNSAINALHARLSDNHNRQQALERMWSKCKSEPYLFGNVHDPLWSKVRRPYKNLGLWNNPMPLPCKVSYESCNGKIGNKLLQVGDSDPLSWMDRKYKITYNLIKESKGKELTIYTQSDLIAHDQYMDELDKNKHKVYILFTTSNEDASKRIEPGAPSFKRRLNAYIKLQRAGYNVELAFLKLKSEIDINLELVGEHYATTTFEYTLTKEESIELNKELK